MKFARRTNWWTVVLTSLALVVYFSASRTTWARGGGGHEGGHEHEHHEEHHAEHHEEHHEGEHHHEGERVAHDDHHDDHHWNHHHHDWHDSGWGWGPGFWGGAAAGYGLGAWSGWGAPAAGYYAGGDTYVDNSNSGNTTENSADTVPQNTADGNIADNNQYNNNQSGIGPNQTASSATAQADGKPSRLPVDAWPELGVSTFSGNNGDQRGLVVVRVKPDSVAQRAGLVPGDVILKLNGQPTPDDEALENLLESTHGTFDLSVVDANTGDARTLTGALGEPKPNS